MFDIFPVLKGNVLVDIVFVEVRHIQDFQYIAAQIDKRKPHRFPRLGLGYPKPVHHLPDGTLPLLFDEPVIQDTHSLSQCQ